LSTEKISFSSVELLFPLLLYHRNKSTPQPLAEARDDGEVARKRTVVDDRGTAGEPDFRTPTVALIPRRGKPLGIAL
jgi:hypothetical protein